MGCLSSARAVSLYGVPEHSTRTHTPFMGRQMPPRGSRQTLTLLAVRILMHLPSQDALLVGGRRGVLDQLEEGVVHLASQGRRLGLLGPGCVFFIPGHQRIRLGMLTGQRPSGGAHHHLRTPILSLLLGSHTSGPPPTPRHRRSPPPKATHHSLPSPYPRHLWLLRCSLAHCPASGSTHIEGSPVQGPKFSNSGGWVEGGQGRGRGGKVSLTYTAHSSFSLRIDQ